MDKLSVKTNVESYTRNIRNVQETINKLKQDYANIGTDIEILKLFIEHNIYELNLQKILDKIKSEIENTTNKIRTLTTPEQKPEKDQETEYLNKLERDKSLIEEKKNSGGADYFEKDDNYFVNLFNELEEEERRKGRNPQHERQGNNDYANPFENKREEERREGRSPQHEKQGNNDYANPFGLKREDEPQRKDPQHEGQGNNDYANPFGQI